MCVSVFVVWVNLGVFLGGLAAVTAGFCNAICLVLCLSFGEKLYQIINAFAETLNVAEQ